MPWTCPLRMKFFFGKAPLRTMHYFFNLFAIIKFLFCFFYLSHLWLISTTRGTASTLCFYPHPKRIHLFIYSFIHLFIYSFIHLFIYSFIHSFIHLFIYSFIHLFIHSFIHLSIHPFINLLIY